MPTGIYKRTKPIWNKGKHLSKEHKIKISKAMKGRIITKEWKEKISKSMKGKITWLNFQKGEKHPCWKGGKRIIGRYVYIFKPNHPFCNHRKCIPEHRFIMEKYLGRYLTSKEVVHHINGNPIDNRIRNLILCSNHTEHMKYHK